MDIHSFYSETNLPTVEKGISGDLRGYFGDIDVGKNDCGIVPTSNIGEVISF